jgi:hypothetical protein
MDKESILKMSRQENKNQDLFEKETTTFAAKIAAVASAILGCIFFFAGIMIKGEQNYGFFALIASTNAVLFLTRGIKLKRIIDILAGILWTIVTVLCSVSFICSLVATSTIL